MARGFELNVSIRGANALIDACRHAERVAPEEVREEAAEVAEDLANRVRAAGMASSRQSARAAATVRAEAGALPSVTAGPHALLFGAEFGAKRRFGWYARGRYWDSPGRQFRPHTNAGYWFWPTVEANRAWATEHWAEVVDEILAGF